MPALVEHGLPTSGPTAERPSNAPAGFRYFDTTLNEQMTYNGTEWQGGLTFATYKFTGTPAATDQAFFVAPRAMRVKSISCVFSAAAGGVSKLQVTKDTSTNAPGAGADLLTNNTNTGFDLNAAANTSQVGTLTATAADLDLAAGDRLSVDFGHLIQSSAGIVVTVGLVPIN